MKIINNKLENNLPIRTVKNFPIKNIEFIDITPLLMDATCYRKIIDKLTEDVKNSGAEYIIAPEARGFLLGSAIAYNLNIGLIPVRKKNKLPPSAIETEFEYTKEYGKDILCLPKLSNDIYKNKKIYVIDDIYATGNTVNSIKDGLAKLGASVVGVGVILNIIELNNDNIYSLIDVNEEN